MSKIRTEQLIIIIIEILNYIIEYAFYIIYVYMYIKLFI